MSGYKWFLLAVALLLPAHFSRAATIMFAPDPSTIMPGGFFDSGSPDGAARLAALADLKTYIESVITNPGSVTIELSTFTDAGSATLATGGQFYSGVPPMASGIVFGDVQSKLLFGTPTPDPQGFVVFNTAKASYLGSDPLAIAPMETDFRSIVLHEITHALGWESFMKPDDLTSALTDFLMDTFPGMYGSLGEVYSMYDTFLVDSMTHPLILPGGAANMDSLPSGGASIASPHAIAANGGELVPTATVPFLSTDLSHVDSSVDSIMNPTLAGGITKREWTDIDLAVLQDLGYTVVPEPSSVVLLLAGAIACGALCAICGAGRRRDTHARPAAGFERAYPGNTGNEWSHLDVNGKLVVGCQPTAAHGRPNDRAPLLRAAGF